MSSVVKFETNKLAGEKLLEKDHGYIGRQFSSEHINDGYLSQGELGNIFENVCFKFHTQRKYHKKLKRSNAVKRFHDESFN